MTGRSLVLSGAELRAALAALSHDVLARVYVALGQGRPLEAQRILAHDLGDGVAAKEIVASLIRREWIGGEK